MADSGTTEAVSSAGLSSQPLPLAFGYAWATGKRAFYYMRQNTGNENTDYKRVGIWLLGEGEWDGCNELWVNDQLVWTSEFDDLDQFHFHRGADAVIGLGLNPVSVGPDQGVDRFWTYFPQGLNTLTFNRIAYYSIYRKQAIQNQTNNHQNDASQWTDVNPVGLWRTTRCRIFNDQGRLSGYAFTTNPAWHFVEAILRRRIKPDFNIDRWKGAEDLTDAERARFDWGSIYESAQYYDEFLANGRRRFTGNYYFASGTTLNAILERILLASRSYTQEYAGKIYLLCDKPRATFFNFTREHLAPGSWNPNDQAVHRAPNNVIAKFRDLLVPAAGEILSISCPDRTNPVVRSRKPHCLANNDRIAIGGTGTIYDGVQVVKAVPSGSSVSSFTLKSRGDNYPANVGAGGSFGLLYSRFKDRAPVFRHKANQLARGARGLGIPRVRSKVTQQLDYDVSTFEQVARLAKYERDRALGRDTTPYVTPASINLRASMFARDAAGNLLSAFMPGGGINIDDTANFPYAGRYEILERSIKPPCAAAMQSNSFVRKADASSGEWNLVLGPYNEDAMSDSNSDLEAGWVNVPGSDPGNDSSYTAVDLANNELLAFLSGGLPSGSTFQLPSIGLNPDDMIAVASPEGYMWQNPNGSATDHAMHTIKECSVDSHRRLSLIYSDCNWGNTWTGDVNFLAAAWRSLSAQKTYLAQMVYVEFTLAGGEKIVIGKGVLNDGDTFQLPAGYDPNNMMAIASPSSGAFSTEKSQGVSCWIDGQTAHVQYQNGNGDTWAGYVQVFLIAYKNNGGTWATQAITGGRWATVTLSTGMIFGIGLARLSNGQNFALPASAGDGKTLQAITSPRSVACPNAAWAAEGVRACYLDSAFNMVMSYGDKDGNSWYGDGTVLAMFCVAPDSVVSGGGTPITVGISPTNVALAQSAQQQFAATVTGSTQGVRWTVNGLLGGNATYGTISAGGLYTAPAANITVSVEATSQEDTTVSASTTVTVGTGTPPPSSGNPDPPPLCFARGTSYLTNQGAMSNVQVYDLWKADPERIQLKTPSGYEPIVFAEWVWMDDLTRFEVDGFTPVECSPSTTFLVNNQWRHACRIDRGMLADTLAGEKPVLDCTPTGRGGWVLHLELAGPSHEYYAVEGIRSHNMKASEGGNGL